MPYDNEVDQVPKSIATFTTGLSSFDVVEDIVINAKVLQY